VELRSTNQTHNGLRTARTSNTAKTARLVLNHLNNEFGARISPSILRQPAISINNQYIHERRRETMTTFETLCGIKEQLEMPPIEEQLKMPPIEVQLEMSPIEEQLEMPPIEVQLEMPPLE